MNLIFLTNNLSNESSIQYLIYLFLIYYHNTNNQYISMNKTILKEIETVRKQTSFHPLSLFLLYYSFLLTTSQQSRIPFFFSFIHRIIQTSSY